MTYISEGISINFLVLEVAAFIEAAGLGKFNKLFFFSSYIAAYMSI